MFFLRFGLFCGFVLSLLPMLGAFEPRVAGFDAFAPQLAVGNAVLVLATILFRRRLKHYRLWVSMGLAGSIWSLTALWPEMTFQAPQSSNGPVLKVVSLNVWYDNRDYSQVADYLAALDVDIVGLVELTPKSKAALAPLQALYPYRVDCVEQGGVCQEMLLSKLPLQRSFAGPIGGASTYVAEAEIVWQGHRIAVSVTHLPPPFYLPYRPAGEPEVPLLPGTAALWQSQQAAIFARYLAAAPEGGADRIVLGDFNSVPWNPLQRALRASTHLENRGAWAPSWPSWLPFFARIPIDHVLTGGSLTVRRLTLGPDVGSDHLPVEAEIAVLPK